MVDHAVKAEGVTRCGFIALIGAPNAGKSTLINALVGSKVAIVTPKVQTTRTLLRGIAMEGRAQLVFLDTPGIFAPRRRLDRAMVTTAWSGAHDADIVAVLIDVKSGLNDDAEALLVLGSSLTVMSGLRFVRHAAKVGKPVLIVNRGRTRGDEYAAIRVDLPLGEALTGLAARLCGRECVLLGSCAGTLLWVFPLERRQAHDLYVPLA